MTSDRTVQGLPAAQVMAAIQCVQYQEGAVVSREIARQQGGTVTLFAFDAGQGLSEHTAPFDALVHVLEGEAEIQIDRQPHRLRGGDLLLMPAQHPHAVQARTPFKMLLILLRTA
jgi:quercetin dioxygenase-like cupin family protein